MDMLHQAEPLTSAQSPIINALKKKKQQPKPNNQPQTKSEVQPGNKSDLSACTCSPDNATCTEDGCSCDSETNHKKNSSHMTQ